MHKNASIQIPADLVGPLDDALARTGQSQNGFIVAAIRAALAKPEPPPTTGRR